MTAPIIEAQIAETFVVNQINLKSLLATKAARCIWVAQGRELADFASRRTHGADAALKMARTSYIAGFQSTPRPRYSQPQAGTTCRENPGEDSRRRSFGEVGLKSLADC